MSRLVIRNLEDKVNKVTLEDAFAKFGKIKDVYIPWDIRMNRPRGFAFVEFETESEAQAAIDELNGKEWPEDSGRNITLEVAVRERKTSKDFMGARGGPPPYGGGRDRGRFDDRDRPRYDDRDRGRYDDRRGGDRDRRDRSPPRRERSRSPRGDRRRSRSRSRGRY